MLRWIDLPRMSFSRFEMSWLERAFRRTCCGDQKLNSTGEALKGFEVYPTLPGQMVLEDGCFPPYFLVFCFKRRCQSRQLSKRNNCKSDGEYTQSHSPNHYTADRHQKARSEALEAVAASNQSPTASTAWVFTTAGAKRGSLAPPTLWVALPMCR